jgi:hypothetical protein
VSVCAVLQYITNNFNFNVFACQLSSINWL